MCSWFPVKWRSWLPLKPQAFTLNSSPVVLFLFNVFFSSVDEQCSKIFLTSPADVPISGFLFKALVKPLLAIALKKDKEILEMRSKHIPKFEVGKEGSRSEDLLGPCLDLLLQGKELVKKEYEVQLYV